MKFDWMVGTKRNTEHLLIVINIKFAGDSSNLFKVDTYVQLGNKRQ